MLENFCPSSLRTVLAVLALLCWTGCTQKIESEVPTAPLIGEAIDAPAPLPEVSAMPAQGLGLREAPTDPAERALLAAEAPAPVERPGFQPVTFGLLAGFEFEVDLDGRPTPNTKVPEEISALDGQTVAVSGFAIPIEFQGDSVSSLILVRNQLLCCFGEEPELNEWVFVNIEPPVPPANDIPVTLFGTLFASPDEENGQIISLYRMNAEGMEVMP